MKIELNIFNAITVKNKKKRIEIYLHVYILKFYNSLLSSRLFCVIILLRLKTGRLKEVYSYFPKVHYEYQ